MTIIRKFHGLALAASVLTGAAQHAYADTGDIVVKINADPLYVVSNGKEYTKLKEYGLFNVVASLQYETGIAGRIRGYGLTPSISSYEAPIGPNLSYHGYKRTFPLGGRPRSIDKMIDLSFPMHEIEGWIVGLCNIAARTLRNKGLSDTEIFSKHRFLSVKVHVDYYVDATGAGSQKASWEVKPPSGGQGVVCMKQQGTQIPQGSTTMTSATRVEHVELKAMPLPSFNGNCKVRLIGAVRLNRANYALKVKLEHSSGSKSVPIALKTAGNKIAVVNRLVDVPNQVGSDDGSFRMHVLDPDASTKWVHYNLNCGTIGGVQGERPKQPSASSRFKTRTDSAPKAQMLKRRQ